MDARLISISQFTNGPTRTPGLVSPFFSPATGTSEGMGVSTGASATSGRFAIHVCFSPALRTLCVENAE